MKNSYYQAVSFCFSLTALFFSYISKMEEYLLRCCDLNIRELRPIINGITQNTPQIYPIVI